MESIQKIKKSAKALFLVIIFVFVWHLFQMFKVFFPRADELNAFTVLSSLASTLIWAAIFVFSLLILYTVKNHETPFHKKNVIRLKIIAGLLAALEPYLLLLQRLSHLFYPIIVDDGIKVEVYSSMGGMVFATGLVVYCISLVFDYGISLQTQVDETL